MNMLDYYATAIIILLCILWGELESIKNILRNPHKTAQRELDRDHPMPPI